MCSIGPLHQVYVFQHTFSDADIEAKPIKGGLLQTSMVYSDNEQKPTPIPTANRARYTTPSDTDRSVTKGRTESSGDELPKTATPKSDARNRRLAVVYKKLDEMDDIIVSKMKKYTYSFQIYVESKIKHKSSSRFHNRLWWWSYDVTFHRT
jgi:hypothetical protein